MVYTLGGRLYVYGKVWYSDASGKRMFATRDIMSVDTAGWGYQFAGAGVAGGPLLMV